LKIFLLDADVIIWCAENNKLDSLFKGKKIKIPEVIYGQIRYKIDKETGEKKGIPLQKYIEDGSLEIIDDPISNDIKEIMDIYKQCPELPQIDPGEIECMTLLKQTSNYKFCTGDRAPMKILGYLFLSDQAVSLEELVGRIRNLRDDFTKKYMKKYLEEGSTFGVQYKKK